MTRVPAAPGQRVPFDGNAVRTEPSWSDPLVGQFVGIR